MNQKNSVVATVGVVNAVFIDSANMNETDNMDGINAWAIIIFVVQLFRFGL
jgi:hypothetical protein